MHDVKTTACRKAAIALLLCVAVHGMKPPQSCVQPRTPFLVYPREGVGGSLLHLSFITRAEDQQSGGMKHTTHGSTTHGFCCETSYCFHFHRRRKLKGKVLMCLFQMRNRERDWEHHGFEDSASHMISGYVVLVVPGGLLLNMALAAPHMKMRTALTQPHSTLRRQSLFWIKQFHYKMLHG